MLIIFIIASEIALALTLALLNMPVSVLILPFFAIPAIFTYVIVKQEMRVQKIEKIASVFLRQISSMLQVGLSFENALGTYHSSGRVRYTINCLNGRSPL